MGDLFDAIFGAPESQEHYNTIMRNPWQCRGGPLDGEYRTFRSLADWMREAKRGGSYEFPGAPEAQMQWIWHQASDKLED